MAHLSSPHHFPQQPQQPVSAHAIRPTHTTTSCAAVAERGGSGAPGPWPSSKQSPAANRTASPSQITAASPPSPHQLFGPKKAGHPAAYNEDPQFAAFKQCNDPAVAKALRVGQRQRLDPTAVAEHLGGSSLYSRLALALAKSQAVDAKEVFEAFEFCERVRRRMRRPNLVDLACGHGLVGILMTALEPTHIRRVVLLDRRKPASHDTILRAVAAVAPWVADGRIVFLEQDLYAADVWSQLSEALSQPVMTTGGPLLGASLLASSSDGESGGGSGASSSASSASSSASSTITSSNSSTIASSNSSTIASSSSMMSTLAHSDDTAFNQRRLVGWSPSQLYNVISKVEDYNKFVPWCRKSMVVKRVGDGYMEAELEVGFQMLRERYISKVTLQRDTKVRSCVSDSALFDHLDSTWVMEQGPTQHSCWLTFDVDFAFRSALHGYVADMFFAEVVKRMVGAFEGQCDKRFGQSSLIRVRQEAFKPRQAEAQEGQQQTEAVVCSQLWTALDFRGAHAWQGSTTRPTKQGSSATGNALPPLLPRAALWM
ncbi:MAG: hypothetical protein WDW36_000219 [Sanguina aurantia]